MYLVGQKRKVRYWGYIKKEKLSSETSVRADRKQTSETINKVVLFWALLIDQQKIIGLF